MDWTQVESDMMQDGLAIARGDSAGMQVVASMRIIGTDLMRVVAALRKADAAVRRDVAAMRKVDAAIMQDGPDRVQVDPDLARDGANLMQDVSEIWRVRGGMTLSRQFRT